VDKSRLDKASAKPLQRSRRQRGKQIHLGHKHAGTTGFDVYSGEGELKKPDYGMWL